MTSSHRLGVIGRCQHGGVAASGSIFFSPFIRDLSSVDSRDDGKAQGCYRLRITHQVIRESSDQTFTHSNISNHIKGAQHDQSKIALTSIESLVLSFLACLSEFLIYDAFKFLF